jgi:hypothetical protein
LGLTAVLGLALVEPALPSARARRWWNRRCRDGNRANSPVWIDVASRERAKTADIGAIGVHHIDPECIAEAIARAPEGDARSVG